MSRLPSTTLIALGRDSLAAQLQRLRERRMVPLREPAAAAAMDSTLLSKIERGHRLPTESQLAALARYYGAEPQTLEAQRIADAFLRQHGKSPALAQATAMIQEQAGEYPVKKMAATADKPPKPVNKRRKAA
jgi:transcriptional regulator with XRE-family HTH domain